MEFASRVREFPTWRPLEIVSWETPSNFQPSPVRLETMVWPCARELEGGNCQPQRTLAWHLETGRAPSLLTGVAGNAPPTKPEYIGKNHSRPGVGISIFQLPTLV